MTTKSFKIPRIVYVIIALLFAFLLVYIFSIISKGTKGPLRTLFSKAGEAIENVEDKLITNQREKKRLNKLVWFDSIRNNKESIINSKRILMGASDNTQIDSYESIINLEDSLGITFPIIHIYKAWGEKQEHEFPMVECKTIYSLGSIPMITWEPWVSAFTLLNYPKIEPSLEKRDKGSLAAIARGDYDQYVIQWANKAKEFGHPFYLRFGHEMNDPYHYPWGPQNNYKADFVNAWRHVYQIFKSQGVNNAIWVWNPHLSYEFDNYYPGNQYVDVISFGVLNFGTSMAWSKWWTFEELLSNSYTILKQFNKPMMISEFGSLIVGGDRSKWFIDAYEKIPVEYQKINSIVFFHYSNEKSTDKSLNWQFIDDPKVIKEMKNSWLKWNKNIKQPDM